MLKAEDFDAVFYPGGHGPLGDLISDEDSIRLGHAPGSPEPGSGAVTRVS